MDYKGSVERIRVKKMIKRVTKSVMILGLLLSILLCSGCGTDSVEEKQGSSENTKVEIGIEQPKSVSEIQENGETYRIEEYHGATAKYPVNQMNINSKEKICTESNASGNSGGMKIADSSYFPMSLTVYVPVLFEDDTISSITYTLQNCIGTFYSEDMFKAGNYFNKSNQLVSQSVEWPYSEIKEKHTVKMAIYREFTGNDYPKKTEEVKIFNEAIASAVVKAEISYNDGKKETVYLGMESTSTYNNSNIAFYKLDMQ